MDKTEKLTLIAELNTLRPRVLTEQQIADLEKVSRSEYDSLLVEIDSKYTEKLEDARNACAQAIDDANKKFDAVKTALDASRAKMEKEAASYYKALQEADEKTIASQKDIAAAISTKQARLEEIVAEEDRIQKEEEERLRKAEEARLLAEAEKAKRAAQVVQKPKIRF